MRGLQHKYRETVLFFPAQGQTCHAYCTYCFRWPQFVGLDDLMTENPRVLQGFIDIYGDWIDRFGVDGFRIDTARHVNVEFWQAFASSMRERAAARGIPNFHIFGEVFTEKLDTALLARFTNVAKLPAVLGPECATKSTSTKPGGGSPQSAKVRTGTERRTAELNPARRRLPCAAAIRISDSSRSIVAGLAESTAARVVSSTPIWPCRSSAGSSVGIIGFNRFEQTRSDASHTRTSASTTARS